MSVGGALSARLLSALADDGTSVAMKWLEMLLPDNAEVLAGLPAYSLKVIEEPANKFVRLIKDPLNIISVMGPARSGKSTLMNLLAGCKVTELFPSYPGSVTFTKGVYIPTRLLSLPEFSALDGEPTVQASDSHIKVSFVDTEGQGAVGDAYDMNLFSPALISSRVVIYNRTGGMLTEEILGQLGMMTQSAQRLSASGDGQGGAPSGPIFGHLFIIFNQFRLTAKEDAKFLQDLLMTNEEETDSASKTRNKIRQLLRSVFESVQVYILPDALKEEARDALSDGTKPFLLLDDFRPKYLEYFKVLRTGISNALVRPREITKGVSLNGGALADFMPSFAAAINKAEPLNIPSIFEAAQNGAINKALNTYAAGLSTISDAFLKEEAKPTTMLKTLFDQNVSLLLQQLASTLSYMPVDTVKNAQQKALQSSESTKNSLLATNLTRLKAIMSAALNTAVTGLGADVEKAFPVDQLLVNQEETRSRLDSVLSSTIGAYKAKGDSFDAAALSAGYEKTLQDAMEVQKNTIVAKVSDAWSNWVAQVKDEKLQPLTVGLLDLASNTAVGDTKAYDNGELTLSSNATMEFDSKLKKEYRGLDGDEERKQFAATVENLCRTRRTVWEKNEAETKRQLNLLVKQLQTRYDIQLQNAIVPNVEPVPYREITDSSVLSEQLAKFCRDNKISASMTSEVELDLQASEQYRAYLQRTFDAQIPIILREFQDEVDAIDMNLNDPSTTRVSVQTRCDSNVQNAQNKFDTLVNSLQTQKDGIVSSGVIAASQAKINTRTTVGRTEKLSKYDELVSMYNKALITSILVPVIDKALANKYPNQGSMQTDVDEAKAKFFAKARGEGNDSNDKWNNWYTKTYPALTETVARFNAYNTPGLDANSAATKEIQTKVISNIYSNCGGMAQQLGMSWVGPYTFDPNSIQDMGMSQPDPLKPGSQASRTLRLNNNYNASGYWSDRKTNLEFFEWTVEVSDNWAKMCTDQLISQISDIIWGKPIITDIKPSKIDTYEYPSQNTPLEVTIGTSAAETTTITDSFSWGIGGGLEAGYKWGVKDMWEANVKATFNAKMDTTNSKTATSTFTTTTSAKILLPPNRSNVISQMIFDQRTSLPYTAKVRVIPRLRFQGGFTIWGGGGSYRDNGDTAAIKDNYKDGGRTYKDFDFKRCDEIRDDARADADPWYWLLAMQRKPGLVANLDTLANGLSYEVYVKGRWEGITGKYAVTAVTPKTTSLSLMPDDV
ncbi:hypothetical protein MBLNU459_g5559t2 [Dothideomycetes sp. NU459]